MVLAIFYLDTICFNNEEIKNKIRDIKVSKNSFINLNFLNCNTKVYNEKDKNKKIKVIIVDQTILF